VVEGIVEVGGVHHIPALAYLVLNTLVLQHYSIEIQCPKIQLFDKHIDNAHWVVLADVVVQTLR
jgi:hypothetical protein